MLLIRGIKVTLFMTLDPDLQCTTPITDSSIWEDLEIPTRFSLLEVLCTSEFQLKKWPDYGTINPTIQQRQVLNCGWYGDLQTAVDDLMKLFLST